MDRAAAWCEHFDPGPFGTALRAMRDEEPAVIAPSAVPEGWHPFQLRDKAPEPVADAQPGAPPSFSAAAAIEAMRMRALAEGEESTGDEQE